MMYHREILWLEELVRQIDDGCYTGKTNPARAYRALAGAYSLVIAKISKKKKKKKTLNF